MCCTFTKPEARIALMQVVRNIPPPEKKLKNTKKIFYFEVSMIVVLHLHHRPHCLDK